MNEVKFPSQTPSILAILPKDTPEAAKHKITMFQKAVPLEKIFSRQDLRERHHAEKNKLGETSKNLEFPSPQDFIHKAHELDIKKNYPKLFDSRGIDSLTLHTINNGLKADIKLASLTNSTNSNDEKINTVRGTGYASAMKEIIEKSIQMKINTYQSKAQNNEDIDEMLEIFKALYKSPLSLEKLADQLLSATTQKLFWKISEALEEVKS